MSTDRDKIRRRIRSRRRMSLIVVGSLAGCAVLALAILLIVSGMIPIQGDFDVYLTGPGIQKLSAGSPVAMGLQEVGHIKRIENREGVPVAHVVIQREIAEQLPQDSKFAVESFNEWIPGNLGVRVYKPSTPGSSSPIEDESTFETNNEILPPDLPPKFYLLVVVGLLAIAVVLGLACAIYKTIKNLFSAAIILAIGAAILLAVYIHLNGSITAPDPPFQMNPTQIYESVTPGELT